MSVSVGFFGRSNGLELELELELELNWIWYGSVKERDCHCHLVALSIFSLNCPTCLRRRNKIVSVFFPLAGGIDWTEITCTGLV
jgi:hypothetical protein